MDHDETCATVELIEKYWAEISAVAEALVAESHLAHDDVDIIDVDRDWVAVLTEYRARRSML